MKLSLRGNIVSRKDQQLVSYQKLLCVLAVLLVLTTATVWLSKVDLGGLNIWAALLIASIKASFVLLFFMHLKYEGWLLKGSFIGTIFLLALFIGFVFWDVAFR